MRPIALVSRALALLSLLVCFPAHALDPTTSDCLAASEASLKAGNDHKLREERKQLLVCAANSCPVDIRKECMRRVEQVNGSIPTIVFEAKDGAGRDLSEVKVSMDGEVLVEHLDGTALSIDPGKHSFTFETEGQAAVTKELVAREAEKDRRESVQFGVPAGAGGVTPPPGDGAAAAESGMPTQRVLAIVAAGVGVVGLGMGGTFGVIALNKKNDAEKVCPHDCPTQEGADLWSEAQTAGNISSISFVVGGVALAGAAVLWFTSGSSEPQAEVGVGLGTIRVRGTF